MQVWGLLVYALAVARLTGLVTADEITRNVREAVLRRLDERKTVHFYASYLLTCPWCCSLWLAVPAALLAWSAGTRPWLLVPALALAFSWVAGATSNLGRS